MAGWQEFTGLNRGYVLELYEKYRQDPASVDAETRALFERWTPPPEPARRRSKGIPFQKIVGAVNLAQSIRRYGHLAAQARSARPPHPGRRSVAAPRDARRHRGRPPQPAGEPDRSRRSATTPRTCSRSSTPSGASTARRPATTTRTCSCRKSGNWLRQAAEGGRFRAPADPIDPVALLERLTQVEAFERFLQRTFPGKTRFSIEGLDMLVPILDEVIGDAAESGIRNILIGMAHRGRLNVMAHVLNKPYAQILAEFKEPVSSRSFQRGHGVDRRREVPRRRAPRDQGRPGAGRRRLDAAEPEPPRGGRSGRRGHGARRRARSSTRRARRGSTRRERPDPDPRRRGVPGSGRRGRDAEPQPAARLPHRRHDPHHRQQPARVHDRAPRTSTARRTRAASRAGSRSRSSTSTRTIPKRASKRRGSPSRIASGSSATSSSISSATAATATTRATSRRSRSR